MTEEAWGSQCFHAHIVFAGSSPLLSGMSEVGRGAWLGFDWVLQDQIESKRGLARLLEHHRPAVAHLGVAEMRRSTLADANAIRPTAPCEAVAAHRSATVARLAPGLGRAAPRLIDAARIHAGKTVRHWAVDGAVKPRTVFAPLAQRTTCFAVTSARTNDLKASASEIADLHKARWEIELFFKWVKQTPRLRPFLGGGRNAITLRILAALIAFPLVRLAQPRGRSGLAAQAADRLISAALPRRGSLYHLPRPPPHPQPPPYHQLALALPHG